MVELQAKLTRAFAAHFGGAPDMITRAPGRVNLIGEHTDYNDGFVLPMAIGCGTMVAARLRKDARVRLIALDLDDAVSEFALDAPIPVSPDAPWSNYVRGVAHALMADGLVLTGADMVIAGDVPKGAGLSSSASLEVAVGLMFAHMAGATGFDRNSLALAGQRAEHEFAGCQCGIMDQLVSALGQPGHALLIDCRTLAAEPVPMPKDTIVMIVHSGIERGLVDGAYNSRRLQCEAAAAHYGVKALRDLDEVQLKSGAAGLDPLALRRARHVVTENARTLLAATALRGGDMAGLGQLMAASHVSMRDDFEITLPAIDQLVAVLQAAIGQHGGARMTGGGFGGAVVAIMPHDLVDSVRQQVCAGYQTPAGAPPLIMIETAAEGASIVSG